MAKRYKLSDYKQKQRENAIEIEVDDGRIFTIDPPELWPDPLLAETDKDSPDVFFIAKGLLGDAYEDFVAAGGSAGIIAAVVRDAQGGDIPESPAS